MLAFDFAAVAVDTGSILVSRAVRRGQFYVGSGWYKALEQVVALISDAK